jgi:glycerophosphoryl diester phosphodiesterase
MKTKIIAHRGASAYARENTLEAFAKAIELKAQMIEFDVRRTKDGKFIIFHDEKIKGKNIFELEYREVKEIDLEIPTLEEALVFCKGKIGLDIELKEAVDEEKIIEIILKNISLADFIITSFDAASLRKVKDVNPKIKTGLIVGKRFSFAKPLETWFEIFPFSAFKNVEADVLVAHRNFLAFNLIRRAARRSVLLIIWDVNEKKTAKYLTGKNIEGIITDFPDLV